MATFGSLIAGGSSVQTPPANNKAVSKYTLDRAGSVDAVSVTLAGLIPGNAKAVIYDNTGVGGLPGTLKGTSQARTNPSGPSTFTFSPAVALTAGDYWLGLIADAAGSSNCTTVTNGIAFNSNTYASGPTDPFGASPNLVNFRYPVNAGYTPTMAAGTYLGDLRGGDSASNFGANLLVVFKVIPVASGTVSKLTLYVDNTYASAKIKGVLYDGTGGGGTPGALLGTTTELVGPVINANDLTFPSPVSLTGGSTYYIGFLYDTGLFIYTRGLANAGYYISRTYSLGPPSTFSGGSVYGAVGAFWATYSSPTTTPITVTATQTTTLALGRSPSLRRVATQTHGVVLGYVVVPGTVTTPITVSATQPTSVRLQRSLALRLATASVSQQVALRLDRLAAPAKHFVAAAREHRFTPAGRRVRFTAEVR